MSSDSETGCQCLTHGHDYVFGVTRVCERWRGGGVRGFQRHVSVVSQRQMKGLREGRRTKIESATEKGPVVECLIEEGEECVGCEFDINTNVCAVGCNMSKQTRTLSILFVWPAEFNGSSEIKEKKSCMFDHSTITAQH